MNETDLMELLKYTSDLNAIKSARKYLQTPAEKVKYLNTLRDIVSRRMPKNKVGATLISDFDLIDAEPEEHAEAIVKAKGLWKE